MWLWIFLVAAPIRLGFRAAIGLFFYLTHSLIYPLISVGCISCFHLLSSVRPVFTTIHYYPPNSTAAWFVVSTVGAVKGTIANIYDDNTDKGTTPEGEGPSRQ